jgi:hypothetical protein
MVGSLGAIAFTFLSCAINFAISFFNARSVGKIWSEVKQIKGFPKVLAYCGYIMAVAGFTMVYSTILLFLIGYVGPSMGFISESTAYYLFEIVSTLSYILIIFTILPTGIIIWINSLIVFWRNKSLKTGGIAAWNTYAMARNVIGAARNVPSAFSRLGKSFRGSRNGVAVIAVIVVLCAVLGGYFTAAAIVKRQDRKYDLYEKVHAGGWQVAPQAGGVAPGFTGQQGYVEQQGYQQQYAQPQQGYQQQYAQPQQGYQQPYQGGPGGYKPE